MSWAILGGAAQVHETFRETSAETPFQNGVSSFQCARTYPARTEQKGGHKRTLGFLCSACSFGAPHDTLLLLPRQRRQLSTFDFEIAPASASKKGPGRLY